MDHLSVIGWIVLIYAVFYTSSKIFFSLFSLIQIKLYHSKYDHIITKEELEEHIRENSGGQLVVPKITIIAPAYNEGQLILDTSKSYLHQTYVNFEVIICSDGGTDGTLEQLIEHYHLYEVPISDFKKSEHIKHNEVKRIFKSPDYDNLIVIDKVNGGKADAQNSGIAIASGEIIAIIDADSILEKNALIHLADIFEREPDVVGIGTPIGILNDSNVGADGVEDGSVPKSFWAKVQVLEYLRSFLLGRMATQKIRGLALVSGAFGVYKKFVIEGVNGYSKGSLAEDMDIDCKVWRYIDDNKLKLKIMYIPEVFCWSEVPNDFKNLKSQRDRWSRGLTETIWKNKDLFLNYKRGILGLFTYPYYVFFEWFTPFVEVFGFVVFAFLYAMGKIDLFFLERIFILYYITGLFINALTLFAESRTGGHYKDRSSLYKLGFVAIIEPLFYHWVNSFLYLYGNMRLLLGNHGWGKMERKGLKK
jgi:hypothetical protein